MATKKSPKPTASTRQVKQPKPAETVRQKASASSAKAPKQRKLRAITRVISRPFRALGTIIVTLLRPFRFVLKPFKTRPARAVGRFLASVLLLRYFRNSWRELKLVEWPNARQTFQLTLAVFAFAIFFSAIISLADYGLDKAFQRLIIK